MRNGPSKARFEQIYQQGIRQNGAFCRVLALDGTGKIGFATPKKLGSTPQRNRLKRRLREAVRTCQAHADWDVVVSGSLAAQSATFQALEADVQSVWSKLRHRWEKQSESS